MFFLKPAQQNVITVTPKYNLKNTFTEVVLEVESRRMTQAVYTVQGRRNFLL